MTLGQLRMLLEVGALGGFSRAARSLRRSQPGVSQAIAALEEELGVTLVRRSRARVTLTEAGQRVAARARTVLDGVEDILATASAARGIDRGTLRLGVLSSAAATVLPELLERFQSRHPRLSLRVLRGSDEEVRLWLEAGGVDAAVVTLPAQGLLTRELGRDAWWAVLPRMHPLGTRPTVTLAELAAYPFILGRGGCEGRLLEAVRGEGRALEVRWEVRDVDSLLTLVREGLGVSVVGEGALPADRRGLVLRRISPERFRTFALAVRPADVGRASIGALLAAAGSIGGDRGRLHGADEENEAAESPRPPRFHGE
jgi:DNA-binding transcriptional LysR family regulator